MKEVGFRKLISDLTRALQETGGKSIIKCRKQMCKKVIINKQWSTDENKQSAWSCPEHVFDFTGW